MIMRKEKWNRVKLCHSKIVIARSECAAAIQSFQCFSRSSCPLRGLMITTGGWQRLLLNVLYSMVLPLSRLTITSLLFFPLPAQAVIQPASQSSQTEVNITLYPQDMALIKEKRKTILK